MPVLSHPSHANSAINAFRRPAPVMAGIMGWKILAMLSRRMLSFERESAFSASGSSTGAEASNPPSDRTS